MRNFENYVLCSFELEKDPIFRICAIRMDSRKKYGLCPSTNFIAKVGFKAKIGGVQMDFFLISPKF